MRKMMLWQWALLVLVIVGAFLLRWHDFSRIFLWLDDTDFFNENLYGSHPKSLLDYALTTRDATTNTWGWPAILWMACRLFGATLQVARGCSLAAGTAAVAAVFVLVYRLLPEEGSGSRFAPAIAAATLTAISMPQMEFSQRLFPYAVVPLAASLLISAHLGAHLGLLRALTGGEGLARPMAYYTIAGAFAACAHPSLNLLLAASVLLLGLHAFFLTRTTHSLCAFSLMRTTHSLCAARALQRRPPAERFRFFCAAVPAALVLLAAIASNAKNPRFGYRIYLTGYYHSLSLRSIPKLIAHGYDLLTYHLNLFYNPALYWPERWNWALLPLVLLCLWGWWRASSGQFGFEARELGRFALLAMSIPAALSFAGMFPFGGVRQTLILSPFLLAFTALGFYSLFARPATLALAATLAAAYLAAWAYNVPRFYADRVSAYNAEDILQVWRAEGRPSAIYSRGSERELGYMLRRHPEIHIHSLDKDQKPPYLLVSAHWPPLETNSMFAGYAEYLRQAGYRATLVMEKPPVYFQNLEEYRTSLYYPANDLWIYKVTAP
ncbi:MAG TPA: hypothetical protein VIY49_31490 [Bryobacteraceae bacterium]